MVFVDMDIVVDVMRRHPPAVAWVAQVGDETGACGFTAMELLAGCRNAREQARVDRTLNDVRIVWPSPASCVKALELYRLTYLSVGMGFVDSLIAQTAIELQLPLHTFNVKHFQHVHELVTVQPYTR